MVIPVLNPHFDHPAQKAFWDAAIALVTAKGTDSPHFDLEDALHLKERLTALKIAYHALQRPGRDDI